MLYTDGIYEAMDDARVMYGEERLRESLGRHARRARSAQDVVAGVVADLMAHVGDVPLQDDLTCLVVLAR